MKLLFVICTLGASVSAALVDIESDLNIKSDVVDLLDIASDLLVPSVVQEERTLTSPVLCVHQIWVTGEPPPIKEMFAASVRSLAAAFPTPWCYRRWSFDDVNPRSFPETHAVLTALYEFVQDKTFPLVDGKRIDLKGASLSAIGDVMKAEILAIHGGAYFDINFQILRPSAIVEVVLADLAAGRVTLANENTGRPYSYMSVGFIAGPPHHLVLKAYATQAAKHVIRNFAEGLPANEASGPHLFGKAIRVALGTSDNVDFQTNERAKLLIHVLHDYQMYPYYPFHSPPEDVRRTYPHGDACVVCKQGNCRMITMEECSKVYPESMAVDHFSQGHTW